MPPTASNSFIPKRNPGSKPRQTRTRNIFLLSIISYALFVAAPLASAGVFIYRLQAEKTAAKAVAALDEAITTFNEKDFDRVIDFEKRLTLTRTLVDSHVSVTSLLKILSSSTAQSVQFKNLELKRDSKDSMSATADILTANLDGVLFQRGQYKATTQIASADFLDVALSADNGSDSDKDVKSAPVGAKEVTFKASFKFNGADIMYTPLTSKTASTPVANPDPVASSTTDATTNENTL